MEFPIHQYASEVESLLAREGGGKRLMPLVRGGAASNRVSLEAVRQTHASDSVRAGLYLYLSCWDEAHSTADAVDNPDGWFWHAITHRQEPDPGNAAYWFRRTGVHPVFPELGEEAAAAGYPTGRSWDPLEFIRFCETAARHPGSDEERLAMEVQLLEWQLLFDHCARGSAS